MELFAIWNCNDTVIGTIGTIRSTGAGNNAGTGTIGTGAGVGEIAGARAGSASSCLEPGPAHPPGHLLVLLLAPDLRRAGPRPLPWPILSF